MRVFKWGVAGAIAVSMAASSALAAESTRSATALPSTQSVQSAPVNGVRTSTSLKGASSQSDSGSPVIGYVLAAVVAAGIVAATIEGTNNDSNYARSAG